MTYTIDDITYQVEIVRKKNKNTYIRLKDNNVIFVTTSRFTTKTSIMKLISDNEAAIRTMVKKKQVRNKREESFYLFGKVYDIITMSNLKKIEIIDSNIYIPSNTHLEKWLKSETKKIFVKRLEEMYELFEEKIPFPNLRIRTMKTRWGVCNRANNTVTLNSNLIKYEIDCLDYVIIHELAHFIHFNHSKEFWNVVEKYCSDYKKIRKMLKE